MAMLVSGMWAVLLGLFINTASQAFLYATVPSVGRGLGLLDVQTGLILGGGAILGMLTAPVWGFLSERFGRRPVLVLAMATVGISPLVLAVMLGGLAGTLPVLAVFAILLAARSVQAAFGSALIPVSQAYTADVTTEATRTTGMGLVSAAISVGTVTGAVLVWLVGGLSPTVGFAMIATAAIVAFVLALLFLREPPHHVVLEKSEGTVPWRRVWPFFAITAVAMTANTIVQPVIGLRLLDQFGMSEAEAVGFAGAAITCAAVGMFVSQALLTPQLKWPPLRMLRVGGIGAAVGTIILVFADSQAVLLVAMAVLGLSLGLVLPGNLAAMSLATGAGAQGKVAGLNTLALGIGLAGGPILGTTIYASGYTAPFWLAFGLAVCIVVVAFVAARTVGTAPAQAAEAATRPLPTH